MGLYAPIACLHDHLTFFLSITASSPCTPEYTPHTFFYSPNYRNSLRRLVSNYIKTALVVCPYFFSYLRLCVMYLIGKSKGAREYKYLSRGSQATSAFCFAVTIFTFLSSGFLGGCSSSKSSHDVYGLVGNSRTQYRPTPAASICRYAPLLVLLPGYDASRAMLFLASYTSSSSRCPSM